MAHWPQPLIERVAATTNTTTAVDVESQQVPAEEVWELSYAGLYNESGEPVTVSFFLVDGTRTIQLAATDQVGNNNTLPLALPLASLPGGSKLRAKVTGVALTGKVTLLLTGRRMSWAASPGG